MKKSKHELNVLKYDYPCHFRLTYIPQYISQFFWNIKWAYQRIVWGYCERDTFNLDNYYSYLFYYTLTYFAEHLHGFPVYFEDENEWKKYLHDMAAHFYNSIEGAPGVWTTEKTEKLWEELEKMSDGSLFERVLKEGYTQEEYNQKTKEWIEAENEAADFTLKEAKEGLAMMQKVYRNLWD